VLYNGPKPWVGPPDASERAFNSFLRESLLPGRFPEARIPAMLEDRTRIEGADSEQLLEWGERVLTARSLEEIFSG
jgi:hypothetical protein